MSTSGEDTPEKETTDVASSSAPADSTHSVTQNVFVSTLATKSIAQATKAIDDSPRSIGSAHERQALIRSVAESTFHALKNQAAREGFIPWNLAQSATLEDMAVVDAKLNDTVQRVALQAESGTLPLDADTHGPATNLALAATTRAGPSARSALASMASAALPQVPTSTSVATPPGAGWRATERYTYLHRLGYGGFGQVFLVADRLLGKKYAVKQIELARDATKEEVEEVVAEVRALAQMSHGNVVRLYSAWSEPQAHRLFGLDSGEVTLDDESYFSVARSRFLGEEDCNSSHNSGHAWTDQRSRPGQPQRVSTAEVLDEEEEQEGEDYEEEEEEEEEDDDEGSSDAAMSSDDISAPFARMSDYSHSRELDSTSHSKSREDTGGILFTNDATPSVAPSHHGHDRTEHSMALIRRTPQVSVEDSTDRSVPAEPPSSAQHAALVLTPSARVLCYSMDFHPMNLEKYIFRYARDDEAAGPSTQLDQDHPPGHCGHLIPALDMLSAICDGLCHIHSKQYAHRDVKPANILISLHNTKPDNASYVELTGCPECDFASNGPRVFAVPHVTDFGTAVAIGYGKAVSEAGTRAYNPMDRVPTEKSDVYALGIIALEMLSNPKTAAERMMVRDCKTVQGTYGTESNLVIKTGIHGMTKKDAVDRWGMKEVRQWISQLRAMWCSRSASFTQGH